MILLLIYISRYNTFSPDVVKKMSKASLTEEVKFAVIPFIRIVLNAILDLPDIHA